MIWKTLAAMGMLLLLPACAANLLNAARADCGAFGFQPGSDAFAGCVERAYAQRQQVMAAAWARTVPLPAPPVAPPAADGLPGQVHSPGVGIAFFKSQAVQGASRICTYERIGGPYVITIRAAEMCPLSIH